MERKRDRGTGRQRDHFNYNRGRVVEGARRRGREILDCGFELQEMKESGD